jgi:hypothetical protein
MQVSILGVTKVLTKACNMQARYTRSSTMRAGASTGSRGLRRATAAMAIQPTHEAR